MISISFSNSVRADDILEEFLVTDVLSLPACKYVRTSTLKTETSSPPLPIFQNVDRIYIQARPRIAMPQSGPLSLFDRQELQLLAGCTLKSWLANSNRKPIYLIPPGSNYLDIKKSPDPATLTVFVDVELLGKKYSPSYSPEIVTFQVHYYRPGIGDPESLTSHCAAAFPLTDNVEVTRGHLTQSMRSCLAKKYASVATKPRSQQ